jgi:hypothetical protein
MGRGGFAPRRLGAGGEDAEALLSLEVEEKRQKVRKLRVANDREDTLLIPGDPMRAHVFAALRSSTESWQNWPDAFAPGLQALLGLNPISLPVLRPVEGQHFAYLWSAMRHFPTFNHFSWSGSSSPDSGPLAGRRVPLSKNPINSWLR